MYAVEFSHLTTEREQAAFLYSKALSVAAQDPAPMMWQMLKNVQNVTSNLPGFMMFGYLRERDLAWWPLVFLVPGFSWAFWYRGTRRELIFWGLMLGSIASSAAIIFADEGWRVFYTTWPYVALFISLGFASPGVLRIPVPWFKSFSLRTGTVFVSILAGLMIVTPVATRASYSGSLTPSPAESAKLASQELILAARTMTGFAVIPDDTPFSRPLRPCTCLNFAVQLRALELSVTLANSLISPLSTSRLLLLRPRAWTCLASSTFSLRRCKFLVNLRMPPCA
jgi:hypothetical protein